MTKKPLAHFDSGTFSSFERFSFSSRFDERRRSNIGSVHPDSGISRASSMESLLDDNSMRATSVFNSLDPDERGFIKQENLFALNLDLKEEEFKDVFKQLDVDNDGCINLEDFKAGLKLINQTMQKKNIEKRQSRVFSLSASPPNNEMDHKPYTTHFVGKRASLGNSLDEGMSIFSCGEKMSEFSDSLTRINPDMLEHFIELVDVMARDVKDLIMDKHYLAASFQREKAAYENAIRQLEEEYESQISYISEKETRKEVERIEKEYHLAMVKKQEEISNLREALLATEELSKNMATATSQSSLELREELSRLQKETISLQIQLSTSQTECAVIRSEQVTLKQQYQEKISQLQDEKKNLQSVERDFQSLSKQVHMLRDINRRLQDTNDGLRSAIEASRSAEEVLRKTSTNSAPVEQLNHSSDNLLLCDPAYFDYKRQRPYDRSESANSAVDEHGDSGLSTLRDVAELESEIMSVGMLVRSHRGQVEGAPNKFNSCESHSPNSLERTMVSRPSSIQDDHQGDHYSRNRQMSIREKNKHLHSKGRGNRPREDAKVSEFPEDNTSVDEQDCVAGIRPVMPERVFKIVFAGDASVGKSTFIMRLCTDSFVPECKMTIGLDLRNTTMDIDGKIIGFQLWDTAGQERFRSLTPNYFRKADGVLLLYDATYQESFIHVRDWVETIRTAAGEDIPIVLAANKVDLIERYEQEGRKIVSKELGLQLAKENNLIFLESSAKSGQNIREAIEELSRWLALSEDLQGSKSDLKLPSKGGSHATKTSSQCCK